MCVSVRLTTMLVYQTDCKEKGQKQKKTKNKRTEERKRNKKIYSMNAEVFQSINK